MVLPIRDTCIFYLKVVILKLMFITCKLILQQTDSVFSVEFFTHFLHEILIMINTCTWIRVVFLINKINEQMKANRDMRLRYLIIILRYEFCSSLN